MSSFDYVCTYSLPLNLIEDARKFITDTEPSKWNEHSWSYPHVAGQQDTTFSYADIEPSVLNISDSTLSHDLASFLFLSYYEKFPDAKSNKFSYVRLNRYTSGECMLPHWDGITSLFDGNTRGVPILSAVGLINSCEKGGKFIITLPTGESEEFLTEEGTGIVFPSTFIYKHEVTPVESGVRDSFVSWSFC